MIGCDNLSSNEGVTSPCPVVRAILPASLPSAECLPVTYLVADCSVLGEDGDATLTLQVVAVHHTLLQCSQAGCEQAFPD